MPIFSVVIPTYNRRARLLRALRSVLDQSYRDFEVIVVDDGSSDGTAEAVASFGSSVRYLSQRNRGPGPARNAGVRAARGQYVAFLDSDDRWFPWTLEVLAACLHDHPGATWLCGARVSSAEPRSIESAAPLPIDATYFSSYLAAAAVDGLLPLPTGVAISRAVLLRSGGFSETQRVGEDIDLWFRIGAAPGFVRVDAPPLYVRERHEGSLSEDIARSFDGLRQLVGRELTGAYGERDGDAAFVRRSILAAVLMYYTLSYRQRGTPRLAARLYLDVLCLQAESSFREALFGGHRNRFLLTFPLLWVSPRAHTWVKRALGAVAPWGVVRSA
jgi:glycosyltransferase involved in cell wall biosynthesis